MDWKKPISAKENEDLLYTLAFIGVIAVCALCLIGFAVIMWII